MPPNLLKIRKKVQKMNEKEFLYVGYYIDTDGKYILKIGTTNDLNRRAKEHTRNYHRAKQHTMPKESEFKYLWHKPLSKYNTLRYEDKNRTMWQEQGGLVNLYEMTDLFCLKCRNLLK